MVGICPGGICPVGIWQGGNCPVGICPVGICPVGICPGVFVLESFCRDQLTVLILKFLVSYGLN